MQNHLYAYWEQNYSINLLVNNGGISISDNKTLHIAKTNKKDEFYTQLCDIERELQYYENHFKNKTVYCNCNDPIDSNFSKYFINNFNRLGIKKLFCSSYKNKNTEKGSLFEYNGNTTESFENQITILDGDGDFRSDECIEILKQSDIVVTNPPFSLFREYVAQLISYKKKFLIIGNVNAITYREIFHLIKNNEIWLGINLGRGVSGFIVPDDYELYGTETKIDESGNKIISPNNCLWLTNLDNCTRHDEIKLTKRYEGNEEYYPVYDNYDAINVNRTTEIPIDYDGVMGVPITFLHKYNPNQFELVKFRKGNDDKDLCVNGKHPYFRILIKKKKNHLQFE